MNQNVNAQSTAGKRRLLVTAALPYSNGRPHVGHIAGAYLPSDIYVRFMRLRGHDVRFVCGSDDHGVAIVLQAQKEGRTPSEISTFFSDRQSEDFASLGIEFDIYGATSRNPYHHKLSQDFFLTLHEKGYFEKRVSRQFFDEKRAMFLPDRFVKGKCALCGALDQNGDQCENCGKMLDVDTLLEARSTVSGEPAVIRETVHWFLDLSRFEDEVRSWLDSAVIREHTRNYVKGLLSTGLVKRSMTRDIDWGVPLPLDEEEARNKVLYVWFDAPIGYISNTMQLCAERGEDQTAVQNWWHSKDCDIVHFIGEDNTIFHCVIWIAMLKAEGNYNLPRAVTVNQFLNFQAAGGGVEKFSKSRGTAIYIEKYLSDGGDPESLRYYLTSIAPENARSVFKPDDMYMKHNADLANALGNFINRILTFTLKYCGTAVPECPEDKITDSDRNFLQNLRNAHERATEALEGFEFRGALEHIMAFCRECNRYADEKAPWVTRKTDMEATKVTLWHCLQAIKFFGVVLQPFLPKTAARISAMINLAPAKGWDEALERLPTGAELGKPEILFSKIENPKE
jgi:methionyl-tRNA synthetase